MAASYKTLKEDFVSNLAGGSIHEISLVSFVAPACYLLWAALQSRHGLFTPSQPVTVLLDFCINVGGIVLATTTYASFPALLLALILAPAFYVLTSTPPKRPSLRTLGIKAASSLAREHDGKAASQLDPTGQTTQSTSELLVSERPFLTAYRGAMMVVTCHAILAVDFRVFPRRFAKVETWGTSLMDMGVGSFVFSAGVVSAKAYLRSQKQAGNSSKAASSAKATLSNIGAALRHSLPLVVLGLARLASVKAVDYAEHVTEYGVHWNFFFTLAMLPPAMALLQPLITRIPGQHALGYTGLALAFAFEILLRQTRLLAWALTASRTTLLTQNREGAVSCVGYLAIFILGMQTGTLVLAPTPPPPGPFVRALMNFIRRCTVPTLRPSSSPSLRIQLLLQLLLSAALYTLLLIPFLRPPLSIAVSRRLANAPYILWVAAFNNVQIFLFALAETLAFPSRTTSTSSSTPPSAASSPPSSATSATQPASTSPIKSSRASAVSQVLSDFNRGGLPLFLAANLATGAVNLGLDTLRMGTLSSMLLLAGYMGAITAVAGLIRRFKAV